MRKKEFPGIRYRNAVILVIVYNGRIDAKHRAVIRIHQFEADDGEILILSEKAIGKNGLFPSVVCFYSPHKQKPIPTFYCGKNTILMDRRCLWYPGSADHTIVRLLIWKRKRLDIPWPSS